MGSRSKDSCLFMSFHFHVSLFNSNHSVSQGYLFGLSALFDSGSEERQGGQGRERSWVRFGCSKDSALLRGTPGRPHHSLH